MPAVCTSHRALGRRWLARLSSAVCTGLLLSALAACDDPSSAGLDLIGEEGGVPVARVVPSSAVDRDTLGEVTGGFAAASQPSATRVLTGIARDAQFGTVEAQAYIDFVRPLSVPEGFSGSPALSVTLELPVEYTYGDTLAVTRFDLYEIPESWSPSSAPPDTSFIDFDEVVPFGSIELAPTDTTAMFDLPEAWVSANDTLLTDTNFDSLFDGIVLRPVGDGEGYSGPGAVRGFDAQRIRLAVSVADTTIRYAANGVFSGIAWEPLPGQAEEVSVARDGAEEVIEVRFSFDEDLRGQPLNNARFRFVVDETLLDDPVSGVPFVRPLPTDALLYGINEEDLPVFIGRLGLDEDTGTYTFTSDALTGAIQEELLGSGQFVSYQVGFANAPATVDVLPVYGPSLPDRAPHLELVVSGAE